MSNLVSVSTASINDAVNAQRAVYGAPVPDGTIPLTNPAPLMKRNIQREREVLVQQQPRSVRRSGQAYIYTMANGSTYVSYIAPETIQWQPGPGAPF